MPWNAAGAGEGETEDWIPAKPFSKHRQADEGNDITPYPMGKDEPPPTRKKQFRADALYYQKAALVSVQLPSDGCYGSLFSEICAASPVLHHPLLRAAVAPGSDLTRPRVFCFLGCLGVVLTPVGFASARGWK